LNQAAEQESIGPTANNPSVFSTLRKLFSRSEMASLTQRRRQRRYSCHVPVLCSLGKVTQLAVVVDMAEGGLRLMMRQKARPGDELQLHYNQPNGEVTSYPPVQAVVTSSRAAGPFTEAGVRCATGQLFWVPMLIAQQAGIAGQSDSRSTVRVVADMPAAISVQFGPAYVSTFIKGSLGDLSLGGASFFGPVRAAVGTAVRLRLEPPKGREVTVGGVIVRQQHAPDGRTLHGIRFDPLSGGQRSDLSRLIVRQRSQSAEPDH
jgi:hypothetical protein